MCSAMEHKVSCVCLAVALLCYWLPMSVEAFIPNSFYARVAAQLDFSSQTAVTHYSMTRRAILDVAADLMIDNPFDDQSQQRISALGSDYGEGELIRAYFGQINRDVKKKFENAIKEICDANSDVDDREGRLALAHFDSETFQEGQNRIVELKEMIVTGIRNEQYMLARVETGRMLHTLQDFYSHSNWMEMGREEPYDGLGHADKRPVVASQTSPTCTDCRQDGSVILGFIFGLVIGQRAEYHYRCDNNIRNDILSSGLLTSGYYANQETAGGATIEKPEGKCSHGGYNDPSGDLPATGGINKDSPYPDLSPHHQQHYEAASLAEQATQNILNEIRQQVNDDRKFGAYLEIFIQTAASIAYVIDTTGSMGDELPEIQATLPQIRASLEDYQANLGENAVIKYILVPYNDPDPGYILETEDIDTFINGIAGLSANGGGDTPEPSIGALIRAIKASEDGSPIYLFTDAPPSDPHLQTEAIALITEKSVSVTFALVSPFRKRSVDNKMQEQNHVETKRQTSEVYSALAAISGGQVLTLQTSELSNLSSLIEFSANPARTTILRDSGEVLSSEPYTFYIDSSIEQVIIAINGDGTQVSITTPTGTLASTLEQYSISLQSPSSLIATITINSNSLRGAWSIALPQSFFYDIVVDAITDLSFSTDLLTTDSSNNYGVSSVVGKPLNGEPLIIIFQANDRSRVITVEAVNILDSTGTVLESVEDVISLDDNAFAVIFTPPDILFYWQLLGRDQNGYVFSRISDTAFEVSNIDLSLGTGETGYYVLRPGENVTVPIVLSNNGNEAEFSLNIGQDIYYGNSSESVFAFFESGSSYYQLSVGENSTNGFSVLIVASENASDGAASTITVVAESILDQSNDFVSLQVTVTTLPPPEFTENIYEEPSSSAGGLWACTVVLWLCGLVTSLGSGLV